MCIQENTELLSKKHLKKRVGDFSNNAGFFERKRRAGFYWYYQRDFGPSQTAEKLI